MGATAGSLGALCRADVEHLTGAELVDAIVCAEKGMSLLTALQADLMAELAVPFRAGDPRGLAGRAGRHPVEPGLGTTSTHVTSALLEEAAICLAASEVAAALRVAPVTGSVRVRDAIELTTDLRPTRDALAAGSLDRGKCRVMVEATGVLTTVAQKMWVQHAVLPMAAERSTARLREAATRAVLTIDPDGAQRRHEDAVARRDLRLDALPDGMAALRGFLRADNAAGIFQLADLIAQCTDDSDDPRTVGARRIDALSDIADQLLTHGRVDLGAWAGPGDPQPDPHCSPSDRRPSDRSPGTGREKAARPTRTPTPTPTPTASARGATGELPPSEAGEFAGGPAGPVGPAGPTQVTATDGGPTTGDLTPTAGSAPGHDDGEGTSAPSPQGRDPRPVDAHGPTAVDLDSTAGARDPGRDVGDEFPAPRPRRDGLRPVDAHGPAAPADRRLSRQGRRPHLTVTLADTTLAGLDDLPGTLGGHGPIPADLARTIALSAASVTALFVDTATGSPVLAGSREYRPRQALRDQVIALADTCRFPSCRQPSWRCDLDHRSSFDHRAPEAGGATDADNLDPACRRHHRLKHATAWSSRRAPGDLTTTWSSPTGHTYIDPPREAACPAVWGASEHPVGGSIDAPSGSGREDSCPSPPRHTPDQSHGTTGGYDDAPF